MRIELAILGLATQCLLGCGHPASHDECETILQKTAELTLREQATDPDIAAERVEAFKRTRGAELIQKCEGRHITAAALKCIQGAKSSNELEQCLY